MRRIRQHTALTPPSALDGDGARAIGYLREYFGVDGGPAYTGAHFECLNGGGDGPTVANIVTAADIVAVSILGVDVPASASIAILGADAAKLSRLLAGVPRDVDLAGDGAETAVAVRSPAEQLYRALRTYPGLGRTKVSKLMARKRPSLIPVFDDRIRTVLGVGDEYWRPLRKVLVRDNYALHNKLIAMRDESGIGTDISAIRVWDAVCWMHATKSAA